MNENGCSLSITKVTRCYFFRKTQNAHALSDRFWAWFILFAGLTLSVQACGTVNPKNFAEGLRVMVGKGGTAEQVDTLPEIAQQAELIKKSHPAPDWQKIFRADAADLFELLPGNRLLMGEVQISTAIAEPEHGDLVLYDLNSGEKLWTLKRRDLEWGSYNLLAVNGDLVLFQGSSPNGGIYFAVNIETGMLAWEYEIKNTTYSVYAFANFSVYLLHVTVDKSDLMALDCRNGTITWRQPLDGVGPDATIALVPEDKNLFVLAGAVYQVNTATGEVNWKQPLHTDFDDPKELNIRLTDRGLLLRDTRRIALLDLATGKLLWGPVYPNILPGNTYDEISLLSAPETSDTIFLWMSKGNITSINLRTGEKFWKYELDTKDGTSLKSPIFLSNNKIYFTTYKTLHVLDAKSGVLLEKLTFPFLESGLCSAVAPDIFLARDDKVLMLREGGTAYAISGKTNKLLWKQVLNLNYEMSFNTQQINDKLKNALTEQAHAEKLARDTGNWWASWTNAVDYQWRGYNYQGSVNDPGLSRLGANMVFFQSMLGLSDVIEKSMKAAAQEGLAERLNMELNNAMRNHLRSVQQGFFLRPYDFSNGTLVMVVQLDSGKRSDLVYSPYNVGMRYIDMRMPQFIIDPTGTYLYTTEIGTDSANYEKYVKFKCGMPYPSILRYRLSDLGFQTTVQ